jgi:S1-C subfamily serine protease
MFTDKGWHRTALMAGGFLGINCVLSLLIGWYWASSLRLGFERQLQNRQTELESMLQEKLRAQREQFRRELDDAGNRHLVPTRMVLAAVRPIGIEWQQRDGSVPVNWTGTAFLLADSRRLVTAGHVLTNLQSEEAEYRLRGRQPRIVLQLPDGRRTAVKDIRIHASRKDGPSNDPSILTMDVGDFTIEGIELIPALKMAKSHSSPHVGQLITCAGFPTELESVQYPQTGSGILTPTVKHGFIERIRGLDAREMAGESILQHNLPLCGGYSGSPLVDESGSVVGIATFSSYLHLAATTGKPTIPSPEGTRRVLDPAQISFAVSVAELRKWLFSK